MNLTPRRARSRILPPRSTSVTSPSAFAPAGIATRITDLDVASDASDDTVLDLRLLARYGRFELQSDNGIRRRRPVPQRAAPGFNRARGLVVGDGGRRDGHGDRWSVDHGGCRDWRLRARDADAVWERKVAVPAGLERWLLGRGAGLAHRPEQRRGGLDHALRLCYGASGVPVVAGSTQPAVTGDPFRSARNDPPAPAATQTIARMPVAVLVIT